MFDAFKQEDTKYNTLPVVNIFNASKATSKGLDPCHTKTKGSQNAWPCSNSGPCIDTSHVGKKHKVEQAKVKDFFHRNRTPSRVNIINNNNEPIAQSPIQRATAATNASNGTNAPANMTAFNGTNTAAASNETNGTNTAAASNRANTTTGLTVTTTGNPSREFFDQLIAMMRNLQ
jgi:hypothetical protein